MVLFWVNLVMEVSFTNASKLQQVVSVVRRRVESGEYVRDALPSERALAGELGVSRTTIRKALEELFSQNVIERRGNRVPASVVAARDRVTRLGLAMPAWLSTEQEFWNVLVRRAADRRAVVQPLRYVHWDDSSLFQQLDNLDGLMLLPSTQPIPRLVADRLHRWDRPVVMLGMDLRHLGFASLIAHPHRSTRLVLDHLHGLGHDRIDCFSVQPFDEATRSRVEAWRQWCGDRAVAGHLINDPVDPYEPPLERAHLVGRETLALGDGFGSAVLCTTSPAAIGLCRAAYELGIEVGKELAVAAVNDEGVNRFLRPSLTCVRQPDLREQVDRCIDAICRDQLQEAAYFEPQRLELFAGESTIDRLTTP